MIKDTGLIEQTEENSIILLSNKSELIGWIRKEELMADRSLLNDYLVMLSEDVKLKKRHADDIDDDEFDDEEDG